MIVETKFQIPLAAEHKRHTHTINDVAPVFADLASTAEISYLHNRTMYRSGVFGGAL